MQFILSASLSFSLLVMCVVFAYKNPSELFREQTIRYFLKEKNCETPFHQFTSSHISAAF
jgi:hypothetical protein